MNRRAAALLLAATLAPPARGQTPPPAAGGVKTKVDVVVLSLDVLFLDGKGRPVLDVKPEEISVRVAGKPQTLEFFEGPSAPGTLAPEGAPPPAAPRSTSGLGVTSSGAVERRILLWFDLEGLAMGERKNALALARDAVATGSGTRFWTTSYFGGAAVGVREENVSERVTLALSQLEEAMLSEEGSAVVETVGGRYGSGQNVPRGWERRRLLEEKIVKDLVESECGGDSQLMRQQSQKAFIEYVHGEEERQKNEIEALREVVGRFSLLGGARHVIFFGEGFERAPGSRVYEGWQRARKGCQTGALGRTIGLPPPNSTSDLKPGSWSPATGRLPEADRLRDWLAASGVFFHVMTVPPGRDLRSAADSVISAARDLFAERTTLEETVSGFADVTGGTFGPASDAMLSRLLDAARTSYRIGVRLRDVEIDKPYSVSVAVARSGVKARSQRAFRPQAPAQRAAADGARADEALSAARREARRDGRSSSSLPVRVLLRDSSRDDPKEPGKKVCRVDVVVPHGELKFVPEEDSFLAGVVLTLSANGSHPVSDVRVDLNPTFTGPEFRAARETELVRTFTLSLAPGRWALHAVVNDVLDERWGESRIDVDVK